MPAPGKNLARNRIKDSPGHYTNHSRWGWVWPANRRILYNRASADPEGKPWSERKRLIWWDPAANGGKGEWAGYDAPDFIKDKPPYADADEKGEGMDAHSGADPFIMTGDGRAWIWAQQGIKDGPLPTHYEPWESPVRNALYPRQQNNPCMVTFDRLDNPTNGTENPRFPWLSELQPELFAEISPELAAEKRLVTGDWVPITTTRASVEARAMVTKRMRPVRGSGRPVHVIGLPYHWGPAGVVTGDIANDLIGVALDPTVKIHEAKAFTCNLEKGRKGIVSALERAQEQALHAASPRGGVLEPADSEGADMTKDAPVAGA